MMGIRTVWYEDTGRNAPADQDGIRRRIYRNMETGEETTDLPVGALFASPELYPDMFGTDGLTVWCIIPYDKPGVTRKKTHWMIDGQATNCTKPQDKEHRCWIRHGTVGDRVTVDKAGNTCAAGAGSIAVPGYHGFLRNGELTNA